MYKFDIFSPYFNSSYNYMVSIANHLSKRDHSEILFFFLKFAYPQNTTIFDMPVLLKWLVGLLVVLGLTAL